VANERTWALIHSQRSVVADMLETLTPDQWATQSLCEAWTVKLAAAHILAGAEQTVPAFLSGMAKSGFRFNALMRRNASRLAKLEPGEIITRIRARTTTTNRPPRKVMTMLGEIVVHGEDIRYPLGMYAAIPAQATDACLEMYKTGIFPVGGKKRVRGLRLVATDSDWSYGSGPEVTGPGMSILLAIAGRAVGAEGLSGEGLPVLRSRLGAPAA
jgi:uncharacterized protein (TIGR03083 family)